MRRVATAVVAVLCLALLSACAEEATPPESTVTTAANGDAYVAADVTFATDTIQHHAQTLALLDLTLARTLDPALAGLLEEIRVDRTARIETLTTWLTVWEEPIPATVRDHGSDHAGGDDVDTGEDLPGMPTEHEVDALAGAPDAEFEALLVETLTSHLEGARGIAETEERGGHFATGVDLARALLDRLDQDLAALAA